MIVELTNMKKKLEKSNKTNTMVGEVFRNKRGGEMVETFLCNLNQFKGLHHRGGAGGANEFPKLVNFTYLHSRVRQTIIRYFQLLYCVSAI